jgi:hypothetical protein
MIIRFAWDWSGFLFGLAYDKPYKSIIIAVGFLSILIEREY